MEAAHPTLDNDHGVALPPGTRLGNFEVRSVLGAGGFGVVYRAFDHALEREVAVKEYMPATLAARSATAHVSVRSRSDQEVFHLGLASFVKEAKMLASFDHPALIKVLHFWEENNTAYMAMPLLRGRTLKAMRQDTKRAPSQRMLIEFLEPLLGALDYLHKQEVYHRDISPDNIHVGLDGRPILLDFGAARRVIAGKSQALTTILKPSYSPLEQYGDTQRQGPWTDLYALGATVHFLVTGVQPLAATERIIEDRLPRLAEQPLPGYGVLFLQVVDWMLALRPANRPQSVAQVLAAFAGQVDVPVPAPAHADEEITRIRPPAPPRQVAQGAREASEKAVERSRLHLALAGGALVVLAPAVYWLWPSPPKQDAPGPTSEVPPTRPPPAPALPNAVPAPGSAVPPATAADPSAVPPSPTSTLAPAPGGVPPALTEQRPPAQPAPPGGPSPVPDRPPSLAPAPTKRPAPAPVPAQSPTRPVAPSAATPAPTSAPVPAAPMTPTPAQDATPTAAPAPTLPTTAPAPALAPTPAPAPTPTPTPTPAPTRRPSVNLPPVG